MADPRAAIWLRWLSLSRVALRTRCPQGQADPRAAIAGGASGVTMARAGPHPRRARSMRWADVYVPHVSPASMSPASIPASRCDGLAQAIICPPAPRVAGPAIGLMRLTTIGLLPPTVREAYGFSWTSRNEAMLCLVAGLVRKLLPLTPSIVRHWPAARSAAVRCLESIAMPTSGADGSRI